jgi:hypothetical protein
MCRAAVQPGLFYKSVLRLCFTALFQAMKHATQPAGPALCDQAHMSLPAAACVSAAASSCGNEAETLRGGRIGFAQFRRAHAFAWNASIIIGYREE